MLKKFAIPIICALFVAIPAWSAVQPVTEIKDNLSSYAVDDLAMHTVSFKTTTGVGVGYRFTIVLNSVTTPPSEKFILDNANLNAVSFGSVPSPMIAGGFSTKDAVTDSIILIRDGTGSNLASGTTITIYLALLKNPSAQRLKSKITVRTWKYQEPLGLPPYWELIDSGTSAEIFNIDGPAVSFNFSSEIIQ